MTLRKIISGGQTGADIAGLLAAKSHGVETGGWMPKGWITLKGTRPEYERLFNMTEHPTKGYKARTWKNVEDSDATARFAVDFNSAGEKCTYNGIKKHDKPYFDVGIDKNSPAIYAQTIFEFKEWLDYWKVETLNIAGNAHDKWAGMQSYVYQFLGDLLLCFYERDRIALDQEYMRMIWNQNG